MVRLPVLKTGCPSGPGSIPISSANLEIVMEYQCSRCRLYKDSSEVVKALILQAGQRMTCFDCFDAEEKADAERKRKFSFRYLMHLLRRR